ncbi:hypothetical protein Clacol_005565 [Clathrus columnatus]|uniref:FAD-binding domain-containing protein n=1 Tax=Clathrus columnatus TaxID=1419009 RepID=A0AAV5ADY9_9AGAM|nr:hypothetical protein Clacol_005565 [Clathrus columnatus]
MHSPPPSPSLSSLNSIVPRRPRILIAGGGLSGLALANGILNAANFVPLDVMVFERDADEDLRERGGYQIRLAQDGIAGLKECLDDVTYAELKCRYGAGVAEAPTLINPKTAEPLIRLSSFRIYAKARAMSRRVLRAFLLRKVVASNAIQFSKRVVAYDIVYDHDGEHVKIFFDDGTSEVGDILVAADGSKSNIADQVGLNNRTHVHGGYHLASRGPVNEAVLAKLPRVLQNDGAVVDPGDLMTIYDKPYYQDVRVIRLFLQTSKSAFLSQPHLFWAVSFPGHVPPRFNSSNATDLKLAQKNHAKELMRSKGIHQSIIDILDIGSVDTIRLTTEMETSVQPPHNWREIAQQRMGKNGGHPRIFLIGDSVHPMTPGRGMGANQAIRDSAALVPYFANLARSFQNANPEEMSQLVQLTNQKFEAEMLPRAFGWVNASNRSAEMDVSTWTGKALIYVLLLDILYRNVGLEDKKAWEYY